jgi:hypothetical protein
MATTVAYLSSTAYSATDARRVAVGGLAHTASSGFAGRSGVIAAMPTSLAIGSAGGLFISVQPGQAVVDGQYLVTHDAALNLTVDAGGASTRWDAIIVRVQESALGDGANNATVAVVKGTTTSIPTLPARSLLLGTVVVGAGVVSVNAGNIVDRRVYTAGAGGIIRLPGSVADPSQTTGLVPGTIAWDPAVNKHMVRTETSARLLSMDPPILGGSTLAGSMPADTTLLKSFVGQAVFGTDANGFAGIGTPFSTVLATANVTNCDPSIDVGHISIYLGFTSVGSLGVFVRRASNPTLGLASTFIRLSFHMVGC